MGVGVCVSVCLCVCIHVFTCLCIQGNALMHTWTSEIRSTELVSFLENSLSWFLRQALLLTWGFLIWLDWFARESQTPSCLYLSSTGIIDIPKCWHPVFISKWDMESNLGLYTFIASDVHWAISPADISYDKHIQYSSWLEYKTLHL